MKGIHLIYIILPILLLIAWEQVRAASIRDQLFQIRNDLASKQQRLAQVRHQESSTVQKIRQNESGMHQQSQRIKTAESQIHRLQADISKKQRLVEEESHVKTQREKLRVARTVEIYKQLVAKDELTDLPMPSAWSSLALVCFVSAIEQDKKLITGHTAKLASLEQQKAGLQAGKKQQEVLKATGQKAHAKLEQETHQQKTVLASVQKEQERITAEIKEYEARQQRLKTLMARLSTPPKKQARRSGNAGIRNSEATIAYRSGPPLPANFAKFNLPVSGGKVIRGYGIYRHPDWGTSTFSSGLTITAETGSPVRSIAGGTVAYVGILKGYGNIIILDHGQQVFSVYAHCGNMLQRVGAQIAKGETIASVGLAEDNKPSLYFELRSRGKAVNPTKWII